MIGSYLKDGWNLTTALYEEFHTRNTISQYTSGDIFHADFTATKKIGKWTFGPVAYYYGQVSNDSCSATCLYTTGTLRNAQRFNVLVGRCSRGLRFWTRGLVCVGNPGCFGQSFE